MYRIPLGINNKGKREKRFRTEKGRRVDVVVDQYSTINGENWQHDKLVMTSDIFA